MVESLLRALSGSNIPRLHQYYYPETQALNLNMSTLKPRDDSSWRNGEGEEEEPILGTL